MGILESLKDLNVSEECFDEIMYIVEEYINELNDETVQNVLDKRKERLVKAEQGDEDSREAQRERTLRERELKRAEASARLRDFRVNPEEAKKKHAPNSTATKDELKNAAKSEWKFKQGSVNRWKGHVSGNKEGRRKGIELQAEARPHSEVLKKSLDKANKSK